MSDLVGVLDMHMDRLAVTEAVTEIVGVALLLGVFDSLLDKDLLAVRVAVVVGVRVSEGVTVRVAVRVAVTDEELEGDAVREGEREAVLVREAVRELEVDGDEEVDVVALLDGLDDGEDVLVLVDVTLEESERVAEWVADADGVSEPDSDGRTCTALKRSRSRSLRPLHSKSVSGHFNLKVETLAMVPWLPATVRFTRLEYALSVVMTALGKPFSLLSDKFRSSKYCKPANEESARKEMSLPPRLNFASLGAKENALSSIKAIPFWERSSSCSTEKKSGPSESPAASRRLVGAMPHVGT